MTNVTLVLLYPWENWEQKKKKISESSEPSAAYCTY